MTLSTNVYVLDECDPRELFRFAQTLLGEYDEDGHRGPDQQEWSDKSSWGDDPTRRCIGNRIGQGLPAILDIDYRMGGKLREAQIECDEDCFEECSKQYHERECWLDLDFDTAYSYKDSQGRGCGDLHALLVSRVGQWLDAKGVRWEWRNEYSGEVHGGDDRYEKLIDLVSCGFQANAWLRTTVLPAINALANAGALDAINGSEDTGGAQ